MRELVDILMVVSALTLLVALALGAFVLVTSLLKSKDVSRRFFSSRRFFPFRIVRFSASAGTSTLPIQCWCVSAPRRST